VNKAKGRAPRGVRPKPFLVWLPMPYTLRQLEGQFQKVIAITSSEIETEEGDCKGKYVWRYENGEGYFWSPSPTRYAFQDVDTLAEADDFVFLCPLCFAKNNGPVGTHMVMVSFAGRNIPDEAGSRGTDGKPTRWTVSGTGLDDLVLTPSIALNPSAPPESKVCRWHGFVGSNGIPPGHAG